MPIEATIESVTFSVTGTDETGLIPEGTKTVIVSYENGIPVSAYYGSYPDGDLSEQVEWREGKSQEEIDAAYTKGSEYDPERLKQVLQMLKGEERKGILCDLIW